MFRTMIFGVDDVRTDEKAVLGAIDAACNRQGPHRAVRGVCQVGDQLYFNLLPRPRGDGPRRHVIVPLEDTSETGVATMFEQRWSAGFDAIGMIDLGDDRPRMLMESRQGSDS